MIPKIQREFVQKFENKKDFTDAFIKAFPNEDNVFGRAQTIWQFRKKYADELKAEEDAKKHVILAPTEIKTKATTKERMDSLPDIGEIIVNQTHILSELLAIEKEILATLKTANEIKKEHVEFLRALSAKKKPED